MNLSYSLSSRSHGLRGNAYPIALLWFCAALAGSVPAQAQAKLGTVPSEARAPRAVPAFAIAAAGSQDTQEQAREKHYVGEMTCRLCHNKSAFGTQWDIWRNSPHARAFQTLFSEQSREIAVKLGLDAAPHEASQCLRCHVTAYDRQTNTVPRNIRLEYGVQCESCHSQGSRHVTDGRRYWMEGDRTVDTAANIVRPDGRVCAQCHRRNSPTWDPKRYSLPGGRTTGFDFQQAFAKIAHPLLKRFGDDTGPVEKEDSK